MIRRTRVAQGDAMPLFHHANRERNDDTRRVYALFEIAHTTVDFMAALACI